MPASPSKTSQRRASPTLSCALPQTPSAASACRLQAVRAAACARRLAAACRPSLRRTADPALETLARHALLEAPEERRQRGRVPAGVPQEERALSALRTGTV